MPAILSQKYRTFLAKRFLDGIRDETAKVYLFVGHPSEWDDEANPPTPSDTVQNIDFDYWRDMLYAKRVDANTAQFVIPRRDWSANTIYDQYDDTDVQPKQYYVLDTTAKPYKTYKCLWNNLGARSTVAPQNIGTAAIPTQTSDGYVWQYMYTVDDTTAKLFLTSAWMPVYADNTVQSTALVNTGKLPTAVPLVITDPGSHYNPALNVSVSIMGDGNGASVVPEGVRIVGGQIQQIILALGGSGYTKVTDINVSQNGVSTQATARAIIPPYPNHGYDPVKELNAAAMMFTVDLIDDESGMLTVDGKYRTVGLLVDPLTANGSSANATAYRQTTDVTMSANTGVLATTDVVTNITKSSNPTAVVVDVVQSGNNYVVRLTDINPMGETTPFDIGDTLKNLTTGVEITVAAVDNPELTAYSGKILWVANRTPVSRANNLTEQVKVVFPFN